MKKLALLVVCTFIGLIAFAQQNTSKCPFGGRENCTGYCGHFTDENKDSYCDYSKLNEKTKDIAKDTVKTHCNKHDKGACEHKDTKDKKCCKALNNKCKENNGDCTKKGACSTPECTNNKDKKVCDKDKKECCKKEMKDKKACDKEKKECCKKEMKDKKACNKDKKECCKKEMKDKKACDKEKEHCKDKKENCEHKH